jgi:SAM-dependent methyltransferase
MRVVDLGCGVGATTRGLAEMAGPTGQVTGVDVSAPQIEQARQACVTAGHTNVTFVEASATSTGLPRNSFDLVYCRFLLLHLVDPADCLREMRELLKPGGILAIEDGDLTSAGSLPPGPQNSFADLFGRLGPTRGLDYAMANHLVPLVVRAGFPQPNLQLNQPVALRGEDRYLLNWSVREAAPAFIAAGLLSQAEMDGTIDAMDKESAEGDSVILTPRMFQVWATKL